MDVWTNTNRPTHLFPYVEICLLVLVCLPSPQEKSATIPGLFMLDWNKNKRNRKDFPERFEGNIKNKRQAMACNASRWNWWEMGTPLQSYPSPETQERCKKQQVSPALKIFFYLSPWQTFLLKKNWLTLTNLCVPSGMNLHDVRSVGEKLASQLSAGDAAHPGDVEWIKGGKAQTRSVESLLPVENREVVEQAGLVCPTAVKKPWGWSA